MKIRLLAALALLLASCSNREPFYGAHQSGIATPPQKFAFVAAFDLTTTKAEEVRDLLKAWTKAADSLTQGLPVGVNAKTSVPPADTGEALGRDLSRLTLTFGVGPSMFDGRFGLADRKPAVLNRLPVFAGDQLKAEWSDGDLVVQVGADDFQSAYHALHTLTRAAQGVAVLRWVQSGFVPTRNLQGFLDGTVNPDVSKNEDLDKVVWVGQDGGWMAGGSYLVVRHIRMLVETWDRSSLGDQQRTIGRERAEGKPLEPQAEDSHVSLARGDGSQKILRRPYSYVNGLDPKTGQWDSGLLFLAWMKDPARQFIPMQTRLSSLDALNEYIRYEGSALFAVFPGTAPGSYIGASLFPEAPLAQRIEGLLGTVGGAYPALAQADWTTVRAQAAEWKFRWTKEREAAGARAANLDDLGAAWVAALMPDEPNPQQVRQAQTALTRALDQWHAALPKPGVSATDLADLKARMGALARASEGTDGAAARKAYASFQTAWLTKESLVRNLDTGVYSTLETGLGSLRSGLAGPAPTPEARTTAQTMEAQLATLEGPKAFGPWDAGFLLFREGLEALLVLAAILAFLGRTGQSRQTPWVWTGAGLGLGASVAVAVVVSVALAGWAASAPTLVEGLVGLAAVVLMLTVGAWLHGKASIKNWNQWLKDSMGKAGESPLALGTLAFLAVLREGAETVVFFWGLAGSLSTVDLLIGVGGALAVLAVLGVVMIGFSKRLPLQWFFPVATALIYFLAVKILGQSLVALQTAGWIPATNLGFGGAVDWLGFTPTWQTAVPQVLLFGVLTVLVILSILKGNPKPAPHRAT